jgi:hypothetical protein
MECKEEIEKNRQSISDFSASEFLGESFLAIIQPF